MKKIILLLCASIFVINVSAQSFGYGPRIGANASMILDRAYDMQYNFNAGAFFELDLSTEWSVEIAGIYSRQGMKYSKMPISLTKTAETNFKLDYVNIPIVAKYYPWKGLNIFLGPELNILTSAKSKTVGVAGETSLWSQYQKYNISGVAGIGYTWECGFLITAQYSNTLLSIYRSSANMEKTYGGVAQINVGWRF